MKSHKAEAILITQCLQNDFCRPIEKYDPLPNLLHIGYEEANRLMGERAEEGPVASVMRWAYNTEPELLSIINIRDWHNTHNPGEKEHLARFGDHCLQNTSGAEFIFKEQIRPERPALTVNATGLNDFIGTNLEQALHPYENISVRVGIIGVWTEAKVTFLAYDILTRFPKFEVAVCEPLCASSSRTMHFVALDQLKNILGVQIFSSIGSFTEFLAGTMPSVNPGRSEYKPELRFVSDYAIQEPDTKILQYLYRNSKSAEFVCLDGGFSGNVVLKASAVDKFGQQQVPTVVKIGQRDAIAKERSSFERIQEILGNSAPAVVDFAEYDNRGGIKYRYAAMQGGKVTTFQKFYAHTEDTNKIIHILDVVFRKQLARFTDAAVSEKLNLLQYYEFSPRFAQSVRQRCEAIAPFGGNGKRKLTQNLYADDITEFYERDLLAEPESAEANHFVSYVHGDLNGANIVIDESENIWLIDFFHTHRGHALKDLIKIENDILYIFSEIENEAELEQATQLTDLLYNIHDLAAGLPQQLPASITVPALKKAWNVLRFLRSLYADIIHLDKDPYQLFVAAARYAVHTLSFDECSELQKKWALYASGVLVRRIQASMRKDKQLRIDFIPLGNGLDNALGLTILPGRKDRNRDMYADIQHIKEHGIQTIICMLTSDEFEKYGTENLLDEYAHAGLKVIHQPVADQSVPTPKQAESLTNSLHDAITRNEKVLVHCVGGLGRSGLLAALYLKKYCNLTAQQAIDHVRKYRSQRAIENAKQENFILASG